MLTAKAYAFDWDGAASSTPNSRPTSVGWTKTSPAEASLLNHSRFSSERQGPGSGVGDGAGVDDAGDSVGVGVGRAVGAGDGEGDDDGIAVGDGAGEALGTADVAASTVGVGEVEPEGDAIGLGLGLGLGVALEVVIDDGDGDAVAEDDGLGDAAGCRITPEGVRTTSWAGKSRVRSATPVSVVATCASASSGFPVANRVARSFAATRRVKSPDASSARVRSIGCQAPAGSR
jgi:hypothetical protein